MSSFEHCVLVGGSFETTKCATLVGDCFVQFLNHSMSKFVDVTARTKESSHGKHTFSNNKI